jgi:hypothetical protein
MPRKGDKQSTGGGDATPEPAAKSAAKKPPAAKASSKTASAKAAAPKPAAKKTSKKASEEQAAPSGARAWTRDEKRIQNLVALAIGRQQVLEPEPATPGLLVSDPDERARLSDRMLQDSRDASFYLEECALHVLAERMVLAQQAARVWQGIRMRMADMREMLTAVRPPPEPSTVSHYWVEVDGRTFTFSLDWASAPSSEAELHLYRWTQIEAARAAATDAPVWKPTKDGLSLTPYLKRAYPLLPEALAGLAGRMVPYVARSRSEASFEAELDGLLAPVRKPGA